MVFAVAFGVLIGLVIVGVPWMLLMWLTGEFKYPSRPKHSPNQIRRFS